MDQVSDAAVEAATGRTWDAWHALLNDLRADELSHRAIVALIRDAGVSSRWWAQTICVAYEHEIGRRVPGETADGTFQIGVQKTLPITRDAAWAMLTDTARDVWLDGTPAMPAAAGDLVCGAHGIEWELRSIHANDRIRLRRHAPDGTSSTVQVALSDRPSGTTVQFHHEGLSCEDEREMLREHYRDVLKSLAVAAGGATS